MWVDTQGGATLGTTWSATLTSGLVKNFRLRKFAGPKILLSRGKFPIRNVSQNLEIEIEPEAAWTDPIVKLL